MVVKEIKIGEYKGFDLPLPDFDTINAEEAADIEIDYINRIVRKILDNSKITYNEVLVAEEADLMKKDLEEQLASKDMNMEVYLHYHDIKDEEALMENLKEEVRTTYLEVACFEEIAIMENIILTDEEIKAASSEYDTSDEKIEDFHKGLLIRKVVHKLLKMNIGSGE